MFRCDPPCTDDDSDAFFDGRGVVRRRLRIGSAVRDTVRLHVRPSYDQSDGVDERDPYVLCMHSVCFEGVYACSRACLGVFCCSSWCDQAVRAVTLQCLPGLPRCSRTCHGVWFPRFITPWQVLVR